MKRPLMSAPIPFATPAGPRPKAARAASEPQPIARPKARSTPNQPRLASKTKTRKSASRQQRRQRVIEALEQRQVFAAPTLGPLIDQSLNSGAPIQVALSGADADNDALTFTAISDNPNIVAQLRSTTNRYLLLDVSHTSSGQAGDSTFSGQLIFQLFEDLTPEVTNRIITLVQQGFYNNLIFHRIINNFVIQGGDPLGDGTGGSGTQFDDEYHPDLQHTVSGLLSMAKSSDDTNDSQFFITEGAQRNLDFNHSIFGMLVSGESLRDQISNVPTGTGDKPVSDVTITGASIQTLTTYNVLTVKAANGYTGSGTITVTVDDGNGGTAQQTFTVNATPDTNENRPFLINEPLQINAVAGGGAVTHQLQATDVDGGPLSYYAFLENAADSSKVTVSINKTTGFLTVTPVNGFNGVVNIFVVASPLSDADHDFIANQATTQNVSLKQAYDFYALYYDMQSIPVAVAPAAPTSIDLLAGSDTGSSNSDNLTNLNNSSNSATLTFQVSGVTAGNLVQLYDQNTLIGEAVANGSTVIITTNGTVLLGNQTHAITARQVLANQTVDAGTQNRTIDLTSSSSAALNLTVDAAAPIFTSQPVTSLAQFATYNYDANTNDEAGTGASYSLPTAPAGMTINPTTGVVSWQPTQEQINVGSAAVEIQATDAAGNVSTQSFTITLEPNIAPTLSPIATQSATEGSILNFAISAQDPNLPGDTLTYSIIGGPTNALINPITGMLTFAPRETEGGTTITLTVRVTDAGGLFAEQTFDIVVTDTNSNPLVTAIGTQSVTENQELVVQVNASDTDIPADTLSYELISGPAGTTIDANGVIRWTPGEAFGGTQQSISFRVNDNAGGSTTASFLVNVTEQNQLPILTVPTAHIINELQTLTFTVSASDADAPAQTLTYSLSNAPAGMTINPTTGVVTWKPAEVQGPATFTFTVRVTDSLGGQDSESVTVSVAEVNQAPTLGELGLIDAFPGSTINVQIPGADADVPVQNLLYQLDTAPAGYTISSSGVLTINLPDGAAQGIQSITVRLTDASGETVTRDYQVRVSPFNVGRAYGLVSQWTSTISPTVPDNSPVVIEETLESVIGNGQFATSDPLAGDTSNSVIPLIGSGVNRLQAVEEPTTVEAMKPVTEDEEAGTNNAASPFGDVVPADQPQPRSSGNSIENPGSSSNQQNPAAGGNQQSRWQRRFDWREQLRVAALVETAQTDEVDLNWVNRAPQPPVTSPIDPQVTSTTVEVVSTQPAQAEQVQAEQTPPQPLAASAAGGLLAAGMLLRKRNSTPVSIPVVNDDLRKKRGPRRNWYYSTLRGKRTLSLLSRVIGM